MEFVKIKIYEIPINCSKFLTNKGTTPKFVNLMVRIPPKKYYISKSWRNSIDLLELYVGKASKLVFFFT